MQEEFVQIPLYRLCDLLITGFVLLEVYITNAKVKLEPEKRNSCKV